MKYLYSLTLILFVSFTSFGQGTVIYQADPTPGLLIGNRFSAAPDGPQTFTGDGIVVAGTERIVTRIGFSIFQANMVPFTPATLTIRLYTDCPVSGGGGAQGMCGADGAGQFIEGSEKTINLVTEPDSGNLVFFDMENLDISSETDDTIWVMVNSTSPDILGVLNGAPAAGVGGEPATETTSVITKCNTADNTSTCSETVAAAALNNFAFTVFATEALSTVDNSLEKAISVFPNPIENEVSISFMDFVNPTQAKIYDINGRQLSQKYTYNLENNFKMDMSALSTGTYFLHFESEEGTVVKQLIKN